MFLRMRPQYQSRECKASSARRDLVGRRQKSRSAPAWRNVHAWRYVSRQTQTWSWSVSVPGPSFQGDLVPSSLIPNHSMKRRARGFQLARLTLRLLRLGHCPRRRALGLRRRCGQICPIRELVVQILHQGRFNDLEVRREVEIARSYSEE